MKTFKDFILDEDIDIERKAKEVIAKVSEPESVYFENIAKTILEIEETEKKLKEKKTELQKTLRSDVAELFEHFGEIEDKLKTRKIELLKYYITLSKDPEPTRYTNWQNVVKELAERFEDVLNILEEVVEKHSRYETKEPSLRVVPRERSLDVDLKEFLININKFDSKEEVVLQEGFLESLKDWYEKVLNKIKKLDIKMMKLKKKIKRLYK